MFTPVRTLIDVIFPPFDFKAWRYDNRWTMSEAAKEGRVEKTATYSTRADKRKRKRASLSSEYEAASAGTDGKPMPVSIPAVSSAVSSAQVAREWLVWCALQAGADN